MRVLGLVAGVVVAVSAALAGLAHFGGTTVFDRRVRFVVTGLEIGHAYVAEETAAPDVPAVTELPQPEIPDEISVGQVFDCRVTSDRRWVVGGRKAPRVRDCALVS